MASAPTASTPAAIETGRVHRGRPPAPARAGRDAGAILASLASDRKANNASEDDFSDRGVPGAAGGRASGDHGWGAGCGVAMIVKENQMRTARQFGHADFGRDGQADRGRLLDG